MSEAMSDVLSNLRDKASHLPTVDVEAVKDHLPSRKKSPSKLSLVAKIATALAVLAAVAGYLRSRQTP
jgi:hypothetical protein